MSTSWGNCIFINDEPLEMYGKVMTIRDDLIPAYFKLATDTPMDVIAEIEKGMSLGDNPRDTKASLARTIVARYYDNKIAVKAEKDWENQFRDGEKPSDIEIFKTKKGLAVDVISLAFSISKSEVRRLLDQGGVKINDEVLKDREQKITKTCLVQLGKRRYKNIELS
jgi:tyrosyl-tRNA synthetase